MEDGFVRVADIAEIEPGCSRVVYFAQKEVAIFRVDDNFYALDNLCPHRQAPLSAGEVVNGVVTCPRHGARFDLKTGKGLKGPHQSDIACYQLRVDGTSIQLACKKSSLTK